MTARARAEATPMLTVDGLDVAYDDFQVLWGAELRVNEGEIVCVLGPNGAGKSTLMNTISGLVHPRAGRITFLDQRVDGFPRIVRRDTASPTCSSAGACFRS